MQAVPPTTSARSQLTGVIAHRSHNPQESQLTGVAAHRSHSSRESQPTGVTAYRRVTAHRIHGPQESQPTGATAYRSHSPQESQPTGFMAHRSMLKLVLTSDCYESLICLCQQQTCFKQIPGTVDIHMHRNMPLKFCFVPFVSTVELGGG
eukprot:1161545-Pelagomonas_calceolata.AAC.8